MDATPASGKISPSGEVSLASRSASIAKVGLLLWLLAAWPTFLVKRLPHQDLPGHIAAAHVTDHLAAYPEYVATHGLRTNTALLSWLHATSHWLGYVEGARVFLILVLAVTAFGYAFLLGVLAGPKKLWIAGAFAVPLVHHWFVSMGMLNFSLSFALCLWILGLLVMQRDRWHHLRAGAIAVLCALAWIAHSFPLVVLVAIALADLAHARLREGSAARPALRAVVSLIPAALLVALDLVLSPELAGAGARFGGLTRTQWFGLPQLLWMGFGHFGLGGSYWGLASLVPVLVLVVVGLRGRRQSPQLLSATTLVVLAVGYGLLPTFMFPEWGYFNTRFLPFLWLGLLVRVPETLSRRLVTAVACAGIAGSAGNGIAMLRMDADLAEFCSGIPHVEKGARLLPLLFSVSSSGDNIEPELQAWGYYAIERQTSADLLWASRSVDAVQYRTLPPPRFHHDAIQNTPRAMFSAEFWCGTLARAVGSVTLHCDRAWADAWHDYLASAEKRYQYVLVWDPLEPVAALIEQHFPAVHRQGRLTIGRRR